jgi:hypothetical protein
MYEERQTGYNLGRMFCFHRNYSLGDTHSLLASDYQNWQDMAVKLIKEYNAAVIIPLYLYDHSGITIATHPFSCQWDSGQVGYILATKSDVCKRFGSKYCTNRLKRLTRTFLEIEVDEYDYYLNDEEEDDEPEDDLTGC